MADLITPQRIQLSMFGFYLAQEQSAFTISAFTLPSAIQWAISSVEQVYASTVIRVCWVIYRVTHACNTRFGNVGVGSCENALSF